MPAVVQQTLTDDALLKSWRGGPHPERWGNYGDCFCVPIDRPVSLAEFVGAFYTTPLFRIERAILRVLAASPSTDEEIPRLLAGSRTTFAAWELSARTETQLLMSDRYGKTRSWFRVIPQASGGTLLQFGSAVAAKPGANGKSGMSGGFHALLGFHRLYSRLLLQSARKRLIRQAATP